jgi:hypothetical protein
LVSLTCIRRRLSTAFVVALGLAATGCGASQSPTGSSHRSGATTRARAAARAGRGSTAPARPVMLTYRPLFSLAAPLRDPASAALGTGRFVLIGGLDAADTSSAGIEVADLHGLLHSFALPLAQHDAQGAALGRDVYVFGGGSFSELDHILSFDPARGVVQSVGSLPQAQSDVAVAQSGGTAYVVGGYDGTNWLDTILAWRPGSSVRVVAHLPVGLRYSAVSAIDGRLLIIGGSTPDGATDAIYRFDPASGRVQRIGRLPHPVTHAGAATLGSSVYLVGGRGNVLDTPSSSVWSIDPVTGAVRAAGRLPRPLSDVGVLSVGGAIVVAGGLSTAGTVAGVGELVPAR